MEKTSLVENRGRQSRYEIFNHKFQRYYVIVSGPLEQGGWWTEEYGKSAHELMGRNVILFVFSSIGTNFLPMRSKAR